MTQNQEPRTENREPRVLSDGTLNPDHSSDMTWTYVQVMLLEAAIVVALWIFGRVFS
jgi:hypothetical protein